MPTWRGFSVCPVAAARQRRSTQNDSGLPQGPAGPSIGRLDASDRLRRRSLNGTHLATHKHTAMAACPRLCRGRRPRM